eukprot:gene5402-5795_t
MTRIPKLAYLQILLILPLIFSTQYDIYSGPSLSNSDSVQFFYLEAPFPYNAPQSIKDTAGSNFDKYGVSHAGLGIWDTTTDVKFSIELVSNDYVGGLLPNTSNGVITWLNSASIVITDPLDTNAWLNSRLITTTSGSAYSQLITYLQGNEGLFQYYQPVTALYVNTSLLNSTDTVTNDDIDQVGSILVAPTNSFAFVDELINQLGSYGCDLGAFLQIYATSFDYFARDKSAPTVVSWTAGQQANPDVYRWYSDLYNCYEQSYTTTQTDSGDANSFLALVAKDCYHDYAYFFKTTNSVYNITLASDTADYATPMLTQYIYNLPSSNDGDAENLTAIDYVMIALAFVGCCGVIYYFLRKLLGKKARRRVSFEGERVAAKTVENITNTGIEEDNEDRAYFHGKSNQSASVLSMKSSRRYTGSPLPRSLASALSDNNDTVRRSSAEELISNVQNNDDLEEGKNSSDNLTGSVDNNNNNNKNSIGNNNSNNNSGTIDVLL